MLGPFVSASVVSLVFSLPPSLSPMSYAYIILKKKKKKKKKGFIDPLLVVIFHIMLIYTLYEKMR